MSLRLKVKFFYVFRTIIANLAFILNSEKEEMSLWISDAYSPIIQT